MLTIKPPISLRTQKRLSTIHQDMNEKIIGNYSLMNDSIRREELLYLTTSTPDIYFAEGSSTSVLNEITSQTRQEFRLDVINNLVNRIMLSNTQNFSYQDSVYISNVLRKIGITDVNSFMKQVSILQNETRQVNKLTRLYENNRTLLTQLFEEERERRGREVSTGEQRETVNEQNHLHREIYNRLDTAKIYNEISNFTRAESYRENFINHNQMSVSEQTMVGKSIALQQIKNTVLNEKSPVSFYHANFYELADEESEQAKEQSEKLTPAILLNLVDQAYSLKSEEIENNAHNWYSLVTSFYESAGNTIKRYDSYHRDGVYRSESYNQTIEEHSEQNISEINALTEISRQFSGISSIMQKNEADNRSYINSRSFYPAENQSQISNYLSQTVDNSADISYLEAGEAEEEGTLSAEEQQLRIEEQLRLISEKNTENFRKIQEITEKQPRIKNVSIDRQKARENMIRALENPEEIIREMMEERTLSKTEQIEQNITNALYENMSEDVRAVYNEVLNLPGQSQAKEIISRFMEARGNGEGASKEDEGYRMLSEAERAEQITLAHADAAVRQDRQEWQQAQTDYILQPETEITQEEPEVAAGELSTSVRNYINNEYIHNENVRTLVSNIIKTNNERSINEVFNKITEPTVTELIHQTVTADGVLTETVQRELSESVTERIISSDRIERRTEQLRGSGLQNTGADEAPEMIYRADRQEEPESVQSLSTKHVEEIIRDRVNREVERPVVRYTSGTHSSISFVHKEENHEIDEELLNMIQKKTSDTVVEQTVEHKNKQENRVIENNVTSQVKQVTNTELRNIEEIVSRNIRTQIGDISDKVYNQIEKRLTNERKRRGF